MSAYNPVYELDLNAIPDPVMRITHPDGNKTDHDPFVVIEKLEESLDGRNSNPLDTVNAAIGAMAEGTAVSPKEGFNIFSSARLAFGLPKLTPHQCLVLFGHLQKFIESIPAIAKINELTAKKVEADAPKTP